MRKVIATDLDGTLFYPKDKRAIIKKENLYFLQSFIDNGGELILISGRSFEYIKRVIKLIDRKVSVVAYNGAVIYDGENIVESHPLDNKVCEDMINECFKPYKCHGIFLMSEKGLAVHLIFNNKFIRWLYTFYYKSLKNLAESLLPSDEDYWHELREGTIYKFMFFFGVGKAMEKRAQRATSIFREKYKNVECNWSNNVIEVTDHGVQKADALRRLCERLGYKDDEVYVVGDSGNDISMFKAYPEHSFCMGQAYPSVKKYAKYTIDKFEELSRYIYEKE